VNIPRVGMPCLPRHGTVFTILIRGRGIITTVPVDFESDVSTDFKIVVRYKLLSSVLSA
jgi:hypothetical protein